MSKVVIVKMPELVSSIKIAKAEYESLLLTGLMELTGSDSAIDALKKIVPRGKVGLKANCLTGRFNATSTALVETLGDLLVNAGFKDNEIIVWDRSSAELKRAGYTLNASVFGRRCFGTDASDAGYSSDFYSSGKANSLVSRILTDMVDSNINMPVLKDHSIAGLSGAMKNMFGAINNPNKYHGDNCNPYAADVSNLEPIKKKNGLIIMDATRVQYHAGPGYNAQYLYNYNGILLATDPVAIDRVGVEIVEHCRQENKMKSLADDKRPAKDIQTAEKIGLGTANLDAIDLKVIEIKNNGTISTGSLF
ncbi:MAG: DUF362 domain-containing protein [Candidatus Zixiibacteriota bacterium]